MKRSLSSRKHLPQLLLIAFFISTILFGIEATGAFTSWHLKLSNFLYSYQKNAHTNDVVVVKIDEKSLEAQSQGGLGRWQNWRRSYFADAIDNLRSAGAKVIGIDVLFTEPANEAFQGIFHGNENEQTLQKILNEDDEKLGKAIAASSDIVLAAKEGNPNLLPIKTLYNPQNHSGTSLGSVYIPLDTDSTARRVPLLLTDGQIQRSFSLEVVRRFLGLSPEELQVQNTTLNILTQKTKDPATGKNYGPITIPLEQGELYTNFFGPSMSIPSLSFVDVYHNNFSPEAVKNKIVLIGEMNAGLHDEVSTPVSFGTAMPGVELHANAIESMLTNRALQNAHPFLEGALLFMLSLLSIILYYKMRPWTAAFLLLILVTGYSAFCMLAFYELHIIFNTFFPPLVLLGSFIAAITYKYLHEERTKNKITDAFSHYVSDKVVRKIIDHPTMISLGGVKKNMSVSFTDIAGFTTISEKHSPEEVVEFLHTYLERMTSVILKYEGTLDKYIGDAIMAFWGAPIDMVAHAIYSCRSALLMHKEMKKLITEEETMATFSGVGIRTGIASGDMIVGNIGSKKRFDYTVIGDTVNLASRLEGVNKVYDTEICVSEQTKILAEKEFVFRILDSIKVKGKKKPVKIYELLEESSLADPALLLFVESFDKVYSLYIAKEFVKAKELLSKLIKSHPHDPVLTLYKSRIEEYIQNPPEEDWDGVYEMKTK